MKEYIAIAFDKDGDRVESVEQLAHYLTSMPILILITLLLCCLCFAVKTTKQNSNIKQHHFFSARRIAIAAYAVYLVILIRMTILPDFVFFRADPYVYEKDTLVIYIGAGLSEVNYIPFKSVVEQFEHSLIYGIFQTLSNIALLIPYAFLSRLLFKSFTTKKTVIVGILISCAIEMIQFFEPRSMDIDDVILNMIGVLLGCFLFDKTKHWLSQKRFYLEMPEYKRCDETV